MRRQYSFPVQCQDNSWTEDFEAQFPESNNKYYSFRLFRDPIGIIISSDPYVEIWIKMKYSNVTIISLED